VEHFAVSASVRPIMAALFLYSERREPTVGLVINSQTSLKDDDLLISPLVVFCLRSSVDVSSVYSVLRGGCRKTNVAKDDDF